jgi:transposase-like protein
MEEESKHPGGRPTKYDPSFCKRVKNYCLLGATNPEIAKYLEVSETTIENWMKQYPEFLGAIKAGREEADAKVAKALYRRALGYKHKAVKIMAVSNGEGLGSKIVHEEYTEVYPPDTRAAQMWLNNRQPEKWRNQQHIDLTSKGKELTDLTKASDEDLRRVIEQANEQAGDSDKGEG